MLWTQNTKMRIPLLRCKCLNLQVRILFYKFIFRKIYDTNVYTQTHKYTNVRGTHTRILKMINRNQSTIQSSFTRFQMDKWKAILLTACAKI